MTGPAPNSGDVFDVRRIRRLVELMNEHDLSEIDLRDGGVRIRLRKHRDAQQSMPTPGPLAAPGGGSAAAAPSGAGPTAGVDGSTGEHIAVIKSIMVGTFFAAPSPEAAPFVKVGDHVGPDTVVCIIEAMKVFNEIPSGVSGQIVAVLVDSGDPVEYGQPLFKVDTRQ
ncbi:MAG: acetyl-CoA carboxylase biotin carboxyl carrier protein [Pirellulales bacterium]